MSGPSGQVETQDELEKYDKLRLEQETLDLKAVMELGAGRRLMYRAIFAIAGAETLSYTGSNDATNFREGRRDVGLTLMREAQEKVPELYLTMLGEAISEAARVTERMKFAKEKAHVRDDDSHDT